MRSQNKVCLGATYKAWEVPFPAIWEAFLAKISLYATRQPMVGLRLDCVMAVPFWKSIPNRSYLKCPHLLKVVPTPPWNSHCIRAVTLKACVFYQTVVKWIFVYILYPPPPPQVVLPNTILPLLLEF